MLDTSIKAVRLMPSIKGGDNFTTHNIRVMELPPGQRWKHPQTKAKNERPVDSSPTHGVVKLPTKHPRKGIKLTYLMREIEKMLDWRTLELRLPPLVHPLPSSPLHHTL